MQLNPFTYYAPKILSDAIKLLAEFKDARLLAGGTFLINHLKKLKQKGLKTPKHIISLKKIEDLKGFYLEKDRLIIKPMTTFSEILTFNDLPQELSVLQTLAKGIGTTPIRNMATVGGNIMSRYTWTEMGAVLLALNTQLHFMNLHEKQETLSVEDYFKDNSKTIRILKAISIPVEKGRRAVYKRFTRSRTVDVPLLGICLSAILNNSRISHARVAVNNGMILAQRDVALENFLNQSKSTENLAEQAIGHWTSELYSAGSDDYKKMIFPVAIKQAIHELINGTTR